MKKQSKKKSIIWLTVIGVICAAMMVLSFTPMKLGKYDYNGFFKSVSISGELNEEISIVYEYESEHTIGTKSRANAVENACKQIEKLLEEQGFAGAKANSLGDTKIKVKLASPVLSSELAETMQILGTGGIGCGKFELRTSDADDAEALLTGKHVNDISIISSGGSYYTVVKFTKEGKSLLSAFESAAGSATETVKYYIYFGGSNELTSGYAFTPSSNFVGHDLYIGAFDRVSFAEQYELAFKAGTLDVELSAAGALDTNFVQNEGKTAMTILLCLNLAVIFAFLILIAVRHGVLVFVPFAKNLIVIPVVLLLLAAMPWIEISIVALAISAIGFAFMNFQTFKMFESMKNETKHGKSVEFSIDSGYRKSIANTLVVSAILVVAGSVLAIVLRGSFLTIGTLIAFVGVFSLLFNLVIEKAMTNLFYGIFGENKKAFVWGGKSDEQV